MRLHAYQVTEESVDALRKLRAPWREMHRSEAAVSIATAEGIAVRLTVERADVEPLLEAYRLRADVVREAREGEALAVGDLALGTNDVVLFNGETWAEAAGETGRGDAAGQTLQFTGHAGQRSETAVAVCTTTDALVAAAGTGEGVLIRIGNRPFSLDVVSDRVTIARFLVQRGYAGDA